MAWQFFERNREFFRECGRIGTFALGNFLLAGICNYLCIDALGIGHEKALFSLALYIAHYGSFFLVFALTLSLFRLIGRRTAGFFAVFFGFLTQLVLIVDTGIFVKWHFHLNLPVLSLFFSPAGMELVNFPAAMYAEAAAWIAAIAVFEWGLWKICRRFPFPRIALAVVGIYIVTMPLFQMWNAWAFFNNRNLEMIRTEAVPFHFGLIAENFLRKHGFVPEKKSNPDFNIHNGAFAYPAETLRFDARKRPNELVIVVDSLRGDFVTPEIMPNLFRRAQTGSRFLRHYSGGNCTMTGMFTLFYGIPGTYWNPALDYGIASSVMQGAKACDYDIGIFSAASLTSPDLANTVFRNIRPLRLRSKGGNVSRRDQDATDDMMAFFKRHQADAPEKPFFAMLMLDQVHANALPANYPKYFPTDLDAINFLKLNNRDDTLPGRVLNCFRNIAHSLDETLEKLFIRLEQAGVLENTVVILTADHGQEANETRTDSWQHNSNYTRYQIHVPMIVGGMPERPREIGHLTTHMDVAVTLLREMGCENPASDYSTGKDLFDASDRGAVVLSSYLNRAILYNGNIVEMTQNGALLSYDLDGKKTPPVLPPEVFSDALEQLARFIR
ncbi:MAG: sulfatase-like hydrolase/transferase [Victivallaceae bacterium]|nr:sulfatase-like hydrolase/transferase [Victivallaceae bacterium]